ncbi:Ribosomal RNA small subunit methyltransferase D [Limihaloglobus sulfuriphilus]|uniref:Ribosomal RNA small subunit methyltransferase D n=1 Tax=Limihaloglobus sulfuriphilus TaxID=1851148 RepID=A0A1Q2MGJ0_9BACT|nr:16S rRNA (guanine(966)-N(2))-methyltransferase RsmD [Limihaloglobus sulfuriphilus]AQQ71769.1 Ribosomal RNA small subunit methyltransferase D [Limihaloglobus sulfuriphilus]
MRIISGKYRGMKLLSPPDISTRPVTDRVKEAVFSIIFRYGLPEGCKVADIFCGTGSFGLECLSRGAETVSFVELNRKVCSRLERNIEKTGAGEQAKVFCTNAFKAGAPLPAGERKYDLVFVDPPFPMSYDISLKSKLGRLLLLLNEQTAEGGRVLVRTHRRVTLLPEYGLLSVYDRREWSKMAETFLIMEPAKPEISDADEEQQPDNQKTDNT